MDISVYEVMKSDGMTAGSTCYFDFDRSSGDYGGIMFEKGFFFLLVIKISKILTGSLLMASKVIISSVSDTPELAPSERE